jgi:hypothetical protein
MKVYHQLVFDDTVEGNTATFTRPEWNELLATTEVIVLAVYATQVAGTNPRLTIKSEFSADERNWTPSQLAPEVSSLALIGPTSALASASSAGIVAGFRRLQISLGGTTPRAYLRIFATGRDQPVKIEPAGAPVQEMNLEAGTARSENRFAKGPPQISRTRG